jgi:hypothetical protein
MNDEIKNRIMQATVSLPRLGGQGVLVSGGFILTAAHCIGWSAEGGMALGDFSIEPFKTRDGKELRASVEAVEPVGDIAVLCAPDDQVLAKDAFAFEDFCGATDALRIATEEYELFKRFPIHILTHKAEWTEGTAMLCASRAKVLWVEAPIEGGTSGGPIVDDGGRLIAIVSNCSGPADGAGPAEGVGANPRPHLALPCWVWEAICAAQEADETE